MKIICIGRNYAEHAKEMKSELPEEPVFFFKPDVAILRGNRFYIPEFSNEIHYEVELVIKICKVGKYIDEKFAHKYYNEIGLGIDFTARDIQRECKSKGLPWEKAKAFENSAVLSKNFLPKTQFNLNQINFFLQLNQNVVQKGYSYNMIFSFDQIIAYISKFVTLKIGDLIYTGTPAGVGPVKIGDKLEGFIEDTKMFNVEIR
ncbi:MAG TPA: FAA hydrolase family protein [Crocinitomix sp.]|nr:FAA hydrolase family protein [Crocinitomix sp.]